MRRLSTFAITLLYAHAASASVSVPWSQKTYGFDGPWNAVTVQVGGYLNGTSPSAQWTSVDLYPGGYYATTVLSDSVCTSSSDTGCGAGGTWDPGANYSEIDFVPTINSFATSGLQGTGLYFPQIVNVGGTGSQSYTAPNSSIVALDTADYTLPSGKDTTDVDVGFFALGALNGDQLQVFTIDASNASDPGIEAWIYNGWLYNTSKTHSYSYGLHIGSAALKYPGSLIFGGYDKGRAIGPSTSYTSNVVKLLDISIGVETGGSPFEFDSMSGLLLDNTSTPNSLSVTPDPTVPYLHLPGKTCNNLAKYLPIKLDSNSGYYLWDTTNASYNNITSSAAYLGFVFPSDVGGTQDITIKVPFRLLNLTLSPIASGQSEPVSYFPCRKYTPGGGQNYELGRAFLQAAFLGANFNQDVSWLAQAPGPGDGSGLGYQPTDIEDGDTTLDLVTGDNYFNTSWSRSWTPLASLSQPSGVNSSASISANATASGKSGLSTGAQAGIGVGVAVAGLIAIGLGILLFLRRRKSGTPSETVPFVADAKVAPPHEPHQQPYDPSYQYTAYTPQKHDQQPIALHELPHDNREPSELPGNYSPTELAIHSDRQPKP